MRILFVTHGSPLNPDRGARIRDRELLLRVAAVHDVSLLAVVEPGQDLGRDPELEARCEVLAPVVVSHSYRDAARRTGGHALRRWPWASLLWISPALTSRVKAVAGAGDFDVVQIEHSFFAPCAGSVPARTRTVLSMHNVATDQYRAFTDAATGLRTRAAMTAQARMFGWLETRWLPRFDGVTVVSDRERESVRRLAPGVRATVVANGVDFDSLGPLATEGEPGTLLFVGNLGYLPNRDAVEELCCELLPTVRERVPEANVLIVGTDPPARLRRLSGDGVRFVGRVDDVEPYYRQAQVAVVPLRSGGGTRLKILEALAYGRCVVSTPAGAEGHELRDGHDILLAAPGPPFAHRIEQALRDPALRRSIARNGRARVEREHGWDRSAQALLDLYASFGE